MDGFLGRAIDASDIYPSLKQLVENTETKFVALGTAFYVSIKNQSRTIRSALGRGVQFQYVTLDINADLAAVSQRFNQSVDDLRSEIVSSNEALDKFSKEFGEQFSYYPTKACPPYRVYVSDPDSEKPSGIIVPYGYATDSPEMVAYLIDDFTEFPANRHLEDVLRSLERETNCNVFVVHGHAEAKRRELKALLRDDLQLEPIVLVDLESGGMTLIEKFERYASKCAYAIALITSDDLIEKDGEAYLQARPNVLLEIGWFMAKLGRSRVMLLVQGDSKLPSDLNGIITYKFINDVSEKFREIKKELDSQNVTRL